MYGLKYFTVSGGWILTEALMALAIWSLAGTGLLITTQQWIQQQRSTWLQSQALEWQADLFERLRLARIEAPVRLEWGQNPTSSSACALADCDAIHWRDHLIADWFDRLTREMPQTQIWLAPWPVDGRLQMVVMRWPDAAQAPPDQQPDPTCPPGWRCMTALGWP